MLAAAEVVFSVWRKRLFWRSIKSQEEEEEEEEEEEVNEEEEKTGR